MFSTKHHGGFGGPAYVMARAMAKAKPSSFVKKSEDDE